MNTEENNPPGEIQGEEQDSVIPSESTPEETKSTPVQDKTKPTKEKVEKKAPSKFQLFLRKLLRTVIVAVILFGAGMLTTYFLLQKPEVEELNSDLSSLEADKSALAAEVDSLNAKVAELTPYEEENRVLRASIDEAEFHVNILSALQDVQSAQLDLAAEDKDAARLSLSRTEEKLEALRSFLPEDQQGVVDGMVERLIQVVEGLDTDTFAADSDLRVLSNSLFQLENTQFVEP